MARVGTPEGSGDEETSKIGSRLSVLGHLGVLLVLSVLFGVLVVGDLPGSGHGANIGLGLLLIPIGILGVPWSVATWLLTLLVSGRTPVLATVVLVAQLLPAWISFVLHVRLYRRNRPGGRLRSA